MRMPCRGSHSHIFLFSASCSLENLLVYFCCSEMLIFIKTQDTVHGSRTEINMKLHSSNAERPSYGMKFLILILIIGILSGVISGALSAMFFARPGPEGPAGPQGAQGAHGSTGSQGSQGTPGINGTNSILQIIQHMHSLTNEHRIMLG